MLNFSSLQLEVAPCNKKGREYTETDDKFVDSPDELVGKDVHFMFKIVNCRGLPNKYTVSMNTRVGYSSSAYLMFSGCPLQIQGIFGRNGKQLTTSFSTGYFDILYRMCAQRK